MEGAASVQSPSHDGQGVCLRQDGRISPKEDRPLKEKGGDRHSSERLGEKGSLETREGSRSKAVHTRHKRSRSPTGCPDRWGLHSKDKKRQGPPSPAQGRAKDGFFSSRAGLDRRGGSAHTPWRPARPASPKRRRGSPWPEARLPAAALASKLCNQMGALQVALRELRAPGGAYLPVPSRCTEPTASQRAWLAWQLAHAGAALHWALAALDSLLAAGARACLPAALPALGALALGAPAPRSPPNSGRVPSGL